ncbi:MAG: DUF72 domain-containing protein [Candidatus Brocadiia bacterium]
MTAKKEPQFWAGTSGYQYDHWSGVFYPEDLPKDKWFGYFAQHFDTVEINNTFYHLPEESTFESWRERAPEGFLYVLKFSRYGSHIKHLKKPYDYVDLFMERARLLRDHLGPILVQLRPNWHVNLDRLAGFLDALPRDQRWAMEFRDPTWLCKEVYELLREHEVALCIHDMIHKKMKDHPRIITADWVYLRFHGADTWGEYPYQALVASAKKVKKLLDDGLDVYAYFNNDAHGYSIENARDLQRYVEEGN